MGGVSTFDHATARIAVQLATLLGVPDSGPHPVTHAARRDGRHVDGVATTSSSRWTQSSVGAWTWGTAPACDRRAFLRGVLLGGGSISLPANGPHVEFVFRERERARALLARLAASDVHARAAERRGRWVVYLKGREEIADPPAA